MRQLADGGDVGVVQAVGGADAEFDLVDAHVQQLLELVISPRLLGLRLSSNSHRVLVVADERLEMMLENGRGLRQRVLRA